jgi:hypothetical protein
VHTTVISLPVLDKLVVDFTILGIRRSIAELVVILYTKSIFAKYASTFAAATVAATLHLAVIAATATATAATTTTTTAAAAAATTALTHGPAAGIAGGAICCVCCVAGCSIIFDEIAVLAVAVLATVMIIPTTGILNLAVGRIIQAHFVGHCKVIIRLLLRHLTARDLQRVGLHFGKPGQRTRRGGGGETRANKDSQLAHTHFSFNGLGYFYIVLLHFSVQCLFHGKNCFSGVLML